MALALKKMLAAKYQKTAPRLSEWLEENIDQALTCFTFLWKLWKRIRMSNVVERFNRELRRRTRAVSIIPNEEATVRLIALF